jgi:antitoxin Phd
MRTWKLQDAKARFSEFVEASIKEGPQMVTRRGAEAAVLVPVEEWRRLQAHRRDFKAWLLAPTPRAEIALPDRRKGRRRPSPDFA